MREPRRIGAPPYDEVIDAGNERARAMRSRQGAVSCRQTSAAELNESVTGRMHRNFTQLAGGLTVGEALDWLRQHPPPARVIYFYVVDSEGRLVGVVPTRRLLLSPPDALVSDIMVRKVVALPESATVLDACEFFIQYRLLAFPVIDSERRLVGMVDIDLYNDQLNRLRESTPAGRLLAPLARYLRIESSERTGAPGLYGGRSDRGQLGLVGRLLPALADSFGFQCRRFRPEEAASVVDQ